jgi:hypothetical protein
MRVSGRGLRLQAVPSSVRVGPPLLLTSDEAVWTPLELGAKLLAWWDAEYSAGFSLSGSLVTSWTDRKASIALSQATTGFKPVYSATSVNSRPGVTFDGTDDVLQLASTTLPVGANPSTIWTLTNELRPSATTGVGTLFAYGGTAASRRVRRTSSSSVSRAQTVIGVAGASVSDATVVFDGVHVAKFTFDPTAIRIEVDKAGAASAAHTLNTSATSPRTAMGASELSSPSLFANAAINSVLVTDGTLTTDQEAQMWAFLKARGGVA